MVCASVNHCARIDGRWKMSLLKAPMVTSWMDPPRTTTPPVGCWIMAAPRRATGRLGPALQVSRDSAIVSNHDS